MAIAVALTGCDGGGTGSDAGPDRDGATMRDASTQTDAGRPTGPSGIEVRGFGAEEVSNGGSYAQTTLDGINPWGNGVADLTIKNITGADLTIDSIALTPLGETEAVEWILNDPDTISRSPLPFESVTLAAEAEHTFSLFFEPRASGPRNVEVRIGYGGDQEFTFTVVARGRDNATLSPNVSTAFQRVVGRDNLSSSNGAQPAGIEADDDGNLFFNLRVEQWDDTFQPNVVLTRVNADGSMGWMRELQEDHRQEPFDIGSNGEVGGGQDTIDVDGDGDVYLAANRAQRATGSFYQAFVMRVGGTDGELDWATGVTLGPEEPSVANQVLQAHAVDASLSDRVIVAGRLAGPAGLLVMALSKSDGSLLWARSLEVDGTHSISTLIVDAATGRAYLGGFANNAPMMARIDGVDGDSPTVGWARRYTPSFAYLYSMVLDGTGLVAALNIRGAATQFVGVRVSADNGDVEWARVWSGNNSNDNNNTHAVTLHDGMAVFSGRVAFAPFDTQGGDGFLLALDPANGDYEWGAFHYSGKGTTTILTDYITGVVSTSTGLWAMHQQTPGPNNMHHFFGRWYQANDDTLEFPAGTGSMRLTDFEFTAQTASTAMLMDLPAATAYPAAGAADRWTDVTSQAAYEEPMGVREESTFRTGTHALLQRLEIR